MTAFSDSQIEDLRDLQHAGADLGAEPVIIGAMAYKIFIEDVSRETLDIDLAVALDLDEFQRLEEALAALGWKQTKTQEQRWMTPSGNRLDLVPAGQTLQKAGALVWPRSGFVMSLAGFDHVFQNAETQDVGHGLMHRVVPPAVLALLKIASYLDHPQQRAKDLIDLRSLMRQYQRDTDRIFSDAVLQAELTDVEFATAFLLGLDLRAIATEADAALVHSFLAKLMDPTMLPTTLSVDDDWDTHAAHYFQQQLAAFSTGFA